MKHKIHGIIPPVATIVDRNGHLDKAGMGNLIDFIIAGGVHGLFFLGTAGEVMHMSDELRREVVAFAVNHVAGRVPVIVGAIGCGTQSVITYAKEAEQLGADALVLLNPYYMAMPEEALFTHFAAVAEQVSLPILIYNLPMVTGQSMSPAFIKRLAVEIPQIIGCKDTIDAMSHLRALLTEIKPVRPDFLIFPGFDEYMLDTLVLGGDGCVPASANFAPHITVGLYEAFRKGDWATIQELQKKLPLVARIYAMGPPFFAAMKEAVRLAGVEVSTDVLPPSLPCDDKTRAAVAQIMEKLR